MTPTDRVEWLAVRVDGVDERLREVESRTARVETRLDQMAERLDEMRAGQARGNSLVLTTLLGVSLNLLYMILGWGR